MIAKRRSGSKSSSIERRYKPFAWSAMMFDKIAVASLLLIASLATAAAENPFVGTWTVGDRESCKAPGDSDEARITITDKRITLYEGYCDIRAMRKITPRLADSAYRLRLICKQEGERSRPTMLLALTRETSFHPPILVRVDEPDGVVITYQRCPAVRHARSLGPTTRPATRMTPEIAAYAPAPAP
jgi:hypothetical protein